MHPTSLTAVRRTCSTVRFLTPEGPVAGWARSQNPDLEPGREHGHERSLCVLGGPGHEALASGIPNPRLFLFFDVESSRLEAEAHD